MKNPCYKLNKKYLINDIIESLVTRSGKLLRPKKDIEKKMKGCFEPRFFWRSSSEYNTIHANIEKTYLKNEGRLEYISNSNFDWCLDLKQHMFHVEKLTELLNVVYSKDV